ncbi:MAG: hypothetical protein WBE09_04445, partial [Candidatus Acidiferrales bacterium]
MTVTMMLGPVWVSNMPSNGTAKSKLGGTERIASSGPFLLPVDAPHRRHHPSWFSLDSQRAVLSRFLAPQEHGMSS